MRASWLSRRRLWKSWASAKPPTSIDELDEVAQAFEIIDGDGNIERVGLLPANLTWWAHVFGGGLYDEDSGTITANDPANVAALEWMAGYWSRLGPEKVAAFTSGFGDYLSTQNPFFVGKEGFKQVGEWFIQFQKKFAPDLEMDMIAAPYPDGGRAELHHLSAAASSRSRPASSIRTRLGNSSAG